MKKPVENTRTAHRSNEDGFTLIETMIAAVVIAIGLVAVAGVSVYVSRTNSTSNVLSILATGAQDQTDSLRKLNWDHVSEDPKLTIGGDLVYGFADANHRTQITGTPAGDLNVSWKVADGPGTTGDLRTVTVHVVQVNAPRQFANGVTVTMLVSRN